MPFNLVTPWWGDASYSRGQKFTYTLALFLQLHTFHVTIHFLSFRVSILFP
uniref:Uncharacterized protein n=1 Tax=Anguilla anguilla TaxID=7936 RepID=A0A0E9SV01_ANGAN